MSRKDPGSAPAMAGDVARVIVSRDRISRRIAQLARRIARCYGGKEVTILAVLTGSFIFLADLIRRLPLRMRLDVVSVSSYPGASTRSRGPRVAIPPGAGLRGRHVLIVDDILDTGRTIRALTDAVRARKPASLRTCVLLRKRRAGAVGRPRADFVGFDVPDRFVVGYGLDFDSLYRNLPGVCVLKDSRNRRRGREDA
jgi:hypoxanthine phosphoribosyltransferase